MRRFPLEPAGGFAPKPVELAGQGNVLGASRRATGGHRAPLRLSTNHFSSTTRGRCPESHSRTSRHEPLVIERAAASRRTDEPEAVRSAPSDKRSTVVDCKKNVWMLRWCDMVSALEKQARLPRHPAGKGFESAPSESAKDGSATFIAAPSDRPDVKESNILFDTLT